MSESFRPTVNPKCLRWARERSRYPIVGAAKKLNIRPEVLEAWEAGEGGPTMAQLRNLADAYKRPLSVFVLAEPPDEPDTLQRLRVGPSGELSITPALANEVREIAGRRLTALAALAALREDPPALAWSTSRTEHPEAAAARLRTALGVSLADQYRWRDGGTAFRQWRDAAESLGALVMQSQHLKDANARGMALPESPLPVVIVASNEDEEVRCFTLMHELVHLGLHVDCDGATDATTADDVEVFCNRVAAMVLMPGQAFHERVQVEGWSRRDRIDEDALTKVARSFRVSKSAAAIRSGELGIVSRDAVDMFLHLLASRERPVEKPQGRPDYHMVQASKLGRRFLATVFDAMHAGHMSTLDVARVLGVKVGRLDKYEARAYA